MRQSTKQELAGKAHEVKGSLKEIAGRVTDNPKLEAEGLVEKVGGKIQKKIGQIEKIFEK